MDGSAAPFVFLIQSAGIMLQEAPKKYIRIMQAIEVRDEDKWASFQPFDGFKIGFSIDFDHPVINDCQQISEVDFSKTSFIREISRARTFGFVKEIDQLHKSQRALGGSLKNAVVLDDCSIINEEGLRYEDEFVKHKVLDAMGDLYLLGYSLIGSFSAHKSGHALNNQLLKQLLANQQAWEIVSFESEDALADAGASMMH